MRIQQIDINLVKPYSNNPRKLTPKAIEKVAQSLKEFGFGRNLYEFCADWVLNHDSTSGIKEAFMEYETQRTNQIN